MTPERFYQRLPREELRLHLEAVETPAFVIFERVLDDRLEAIRQTLDGACSLSFAVKANPSEDVLAAFARKGLGADVASVGELKRCLAAGFEPAKIHMTGPGKSEEELRFAIASKVGAIFIESFQELELISKLAAELSTPANVGVRLNPSLEVPKSLLVMQGATQFGLSKEKCLDATRQILSMPGLLRFRGLHCHAASQLLDADVIVRCVEHLIEGAFELGEALGVSVPTLNFGGGWGIDYFGRHTPLDLAYLRKELKALFRTPHALQLKAQGATFGFEPGRALVGEAGVYVTKVLVTKEVGETPFAITDGGMHHCYSLAGGMGQIVRRNFYCDAFPSPENPTREPSAAAVDPAAAVGYRVTGRLCTPQDVLHGGLSPGFEMRPGDLVAFFNCGAYGPSASPTGFLSHEAAGQHFVPHHG